MQQALFVENLVTFERLAACAPAGFALIYSAGFKGSAGRIANGELSWYPAAGVTAEQLQCLHTALFDRQADSPAAVPLAFFGDLDYSGLAILKSLRASWPTMHAWQPGYAAPLIR